MQNKNKIPLNELPYSMQKVVASFLNYPGKIELYPIGVGNINDTYIVTSDAVSFILQRINPEVFPDPEKVINNSAKVSLYVSQTKKNKSDICFPGIIPTIDGKNYFVDEYGSFWRAQEYIANGKVYERIKTNEQAFQVGKCLAEFHNLVESLPPTELETALPGFHDLPHYLRTYDTALADFSKDPTKDLRYCFQCVDKNRENGDFFKRAIHQGDVSPRIIHGDPKVSNVIFDRKTSQPITMIDIDTVGPGLLLFDIGDCLRSCCYSGGEDEFGQKAYCDTEKVGAVLQGYLINQKLTDFEYNSVYESLYLITFELGVRFLTDYLQGNCYFKVNHSEDNLHRATIQFNLVDSIHLQRQDIRNRVTQIVNDMK